MKILDYRMEEEDNASCSFPLENVFVEAVRAVVSPVTLRSAKENRKYLWNRMGEGGDGRGRRRWKVCAVM